SMAFKPRRASRVNCGTIASRDARLSRSCTTLTARAPHGVIADYNKGAAKASRKRREISMNRFLGLLSLVIVSLGLTQTAEAVTRGGKLVYARYADSLFLDPVLNDANVDIWVLTNLYDTLLQPSADGKTVNPGLATDYKVADDGLTFTLTLRKGTKFSDG